MNMIGLLMMLLFTWSMHGCENAKKQTSDLHTNTVVIPNNKKPVLAIKEQNIPPKEGYFYSEVLGMYIEDYDAIHPPNTCVKILRWMLGIQMHK